MPTQTAVTSPSTGWKWTRPAVLVVEDDSAAGVALKEMLLQANFDVELVPTAEAALTALARRLFTVAVVDLLLPGMDGRTLLARMAENPTWSRIPSIVVSGASVGVPHGAVAFLRKPISGPEFVALVARYAQ